MDSDEYKNTTKKEMAAEMNKLRADLKRAHARVDHLQDAVSIYEEEEKGFDDEAKPETLQYRAKSLHQKRVEEFMERGGQDVPKKICVPFREVRQLRARLILEEALEVADALGVQFEVQGKAVSILPGDYGCDVVRVADECADLSVVTIGTLSACGIADLSLLEEVDRANLEKVHGNIVRDGNGKIQKPKGWERPKVGKVLLDQGYGSSGA